MRSSLPDAGRLLALAAGALALLATSRINTSRNFPAWDTERAAVREVGCGRLEARVAKSGKEGVGVALALTPSSDPCRVVVERVALSVTGDEVASSRAPVALEAPVGAKATGYVPLPFDNEALWNAGRRSGELRLELAGGSDGPWRVPVRHAWRGFHREVRE